MVIEAILISKLVNVQVSFQTMTAAAVTDQWFKNYFQNKRNR